MLTNFMLIKTLALSAIFGSAEIIHAAANPTSAEAMITQQRSKVTGIVVDEMGPVAGASISVKGTTYGTISDANGKFTLDGVSKGAVISVSFVGFMPHEILWNGHQPCR